MTLSPEVASYVNLALNLLAIVILCSVAVWLRHERVRTIELRAQLLGMILALHLSINGHQDGGTKSDGPANTDTH